MIGVPKNHTIIIIFIRWDKSLKNTFSADTSSVKPATRKNSAIIKTGNQYKNM